MASEVKGLDRLLRQIDAIPDTVKSAMGAAMLQNAEELTEKIRAATPRGATHHLERSVGFSAGPAPTTRATGAFRERMTGRQAAFAAQGLGYTIFAGDDDAYYARWVEFGTAGHSLGKGTDISRHKVIAGTLHPGGRAQPFFYPTIRAWKSRMKGRVTRAMNKALKSIASVQ